MLLYFLLGMLFVIVGIPVLENLIELLQIILENVKGRYAVNIAKMNKEVNELSEEKEPVSTSVIGFQIPSNTEEEFEEYEEF